MRISFNVHGENIPDLGYLEEIIERLRPPVLLGMDNLGFVRAQAAKYPNMIAIYRQWKATAGKTNGDDDLWKKVSPAEFVAERLAQFDGAPIWAYTTNEPEFNEGSIQWHVEVMERAANVGLRLVVGNWGVGIPTDVDNDWKRAHRMLELLDQHRETMILGLHEYACGVITSGFIGGTPEERGLIMPESWPQDVSKIGAMWHCGRFNFVVRYCQNEGIRPPRIIITEHGFDDVSDIKSWTEKLAKTATFGNPGGNIRGWKTLETQWNAWFNGQGWSPQRAYFEQLKYADQKLYQGSVVEAQLIFSWGHSSDTWAQFDVAEARELHGLLEDYAQEGKVEAPPLEVNPPSPLGPGIRGTNQMQHNRRVRAEPNHEGTELGVIRPGESFVFYNATGTPADGHTWVWVETGDAPGALRGWVADVNSFSFPPVVPAPAPEPEPDPPMPVITFTPEQIRALSESLTAINQILQDALAAS